MQGPADDINWIKKHVARLVELMDDRTQNEAVNTWLLSLLKENADADACDVDLYLRPRHHRVQSWTARR